MDTENIVRRIIELKKISVELKQTTQDPQSSSTDLIQNILQFGKSMSNSEEARLRKDSLRAQSKNQQQQQQTHKNGESYDMLFKIIQNGIKSQAQKYSEADHSLNVAESSIMTGKTWQETLSVPQQISHLKQQNNDIEQEIRGLKQKLKKLQEIEKQEREQQWKDGLPFFTTHISKLKIFYTKLTISQKDYDKIDYSLYSATLSLQKITLSQLPQTGLSSRPPKIINLMLQDLKQVSYHSKKSIPQKNGILGFSITQKTKEIEDENLIIYQFKMQKSGQIKPKAKSSKKSAFARLKSEDKVKEDEQNADLIETLFMKFQTQEQMKEWDLGTFINYKIMEDINKGQFKAESYNSMNSSTITYEDPNKKQPDRNNFQFKQLAESLNKKKFKEQIKLNQNGNTDKNEKKPISLEKLNSNAEQIFESPPQKKQSNNIKIRDELDSPRHQPKQQHNEEDQIKKQRSDTSHFGGLNQVIHSQDKIKQLEEERIKAEQTRKQKLIQLEQAKKKQAERMQAMKKMEQQLSLKKARQSLRKGYLMTKYAKSALHPYEKKVYLSEDGKRLCWIDISSPSDPKFIDISQISSVNQGMLGVGVEAHMSVKKIQKKGCFVVINLNSKDRKTLDLSTRDEPTMEQFCKDLELYRKSLRQK